MQRVTAVAPQSIAAALGVSEGDSLVSINGEAVLDVVDYEYLCAEERLLLVFSHPGGDEYEAEVEKDAYEPMGLTFESGLMSTVRACKNHCLFCFIDQMPKGGRKTLQFKDDDWRMSFIMGNYITLTNVDEREFSRIIARRVSPLYISVHATDPEVRVRLMRNPSARELMPRLNRLKQANLCFHCQIVCCPGINDGEVLEQTLHDLAALYPAAQSVAVVPVGLTKHREGLPELRTFTREEAGALLRQLRAFAANCKNKFGSAFAFASDELYLMAGEPLPPYEDYEDFPQIENGVGLLRLFERDFLDELAEQRPLPVPFAFDAAGGVLAHPFMGGLHSALSAYNITSRLHAVRNEFFGLSVTVGGLVTGQDILVQLKGNLQTGVLLIPHNMLREGEDVFLDGVTVEALASELGVNVVPVRGDGDDWVRTIFSSAEGQRQPRGPLTRSQILVAPEEYPAQKTYRRKAK